MLRLADVVSPLHSTRGSLVFFASDNSCHECVMSQMNKPCHERWGAGVETQKNVRGEIEGWGRVPFNEPYAPSWITIYDGA